MFFGIDFNPLSNAAVRLIALFTIVEVIVLSLWLDALGINTGIDALPTNGILAAVILFVGLLVEHLIAGVSGRV